MSIFMNPLKSNNFFAIYNDTYLLTPRFNVRCFPCPGVALHHCHVHFDS